jgi:MFS family permease
MGTFMSRPPNPTGGRQLETHDSQWAVGVRKVAAKEHTGGKRMAIAEAESISASPRGITGEERRVIFASSLGTVFEWYDFYLYATLAPFFAALFFPPGNDTAALLSAFATYAAGFIVRPFGAIVFGRIGDLVGRKYTFLVTILVMGISTFAVGLLPTFSDSTILGYAVPGIGWAAPVLLVTLRLMQGLALGGEYGGAATYVAEHARPGKRGFATSWIQTTATLGFFLALLVIGLCRFYFFDSATFAEWGWRVAFLVSLLLLVFSIYIRLKLQESPVFTQMKEEGRGSKSPIIDSFFRYPNNKYVLLALLGATAGQGVVWYTGQFYALFFLTITAKVDPLYAYALIAASLVIGTPFFILFGWLSDRVGRLKIILAGGLIAALTYFRSSRSWRRPPIPISSPSRRGRSSRSPSIPRNATSISSSGRGRSSPSATRPRTTSASSACRSRPTRAPLARRWCSPSTAPRCSRSRPTPTTRRFSPPDIRTSRRRRRTARLSSRHCRPTPRRSPGRSCSPSSSCS